MAFSKARRLAQLLGSDGTVASGKIPADAIDGTKIADDAINSEHYTDISIDTAHIGDDQVTAAKLANAINTDIATGVTANTTANAALPKAGGAMTGAITTNSTFDGVDIATRDAILTSTTTTANAAAPLASPTLTGTPAAPTASGSTSTTQIATTAFVQQELTTLIGGAPSTLNDLNELAAAINDDANYNSTLTTALATKLPLAGGTMTGNISHASNFTLDVGGEIILDADGGNVIFKDSGTSYVQIQNGSGSQSVIQGMASNQDMIFKVNDDGSFVNALTFDASEAGTAIFNAGATFAEDVAINNGSPELYFGTTGNHYNWRIAAQENTDAALQIDVGSQDTDYSNDSYSSLLTIKNDGKVGIGTATPQHELIIHNASNPTLGIVGSGYNDLIAIRFGGGDLGNALGSGNSGAAILSQQAVSGGQAKGDLQFQINTGDSLSTAMFIKNDGKVGIGTTNIDNNGKLHIEDSAYPIINLDRSSISSDGNHIGFINFQNNGDVYGRIGCWVEDISETDGTLRFATQAGTSMTDKMIIASGGKMGIGSSPTNLTDEIITITTPSSGGGQGLAFKRLDSNSDQVVGTLRYSNNSTDDLAKIIGKTDGANTSSRLILQTNTGSGLIDTIVARSNGYVDFTGASDLRVTFGSTGTAGNNDSNWVRGQDSQLAYNSASADHVWEIGGTEHMRLDSAASASVPQLLIKDAHPWIDMVAPDGSVFKSGITMRGGSSSTQAQSHFHLTRDSGYRTLASAGNYDTYIDTTTANTAYGNFLIGTNNTEAIRVLATNQYVGIGNQAPTKQLVVMSSTDSAQMLVHLNNDTAGASSAIYFKADSQITGNSNSFTRAKGGIFFSRVSTRGTGHMYLAVDGVNSDTNASPGGAQLKLTSNPNHGGGLVLKNSAHTVVGRDYTSGVLTNGQSVSWNGSGTTFTNNNLNMNGVGGTGGAWIAGISVAAADGSPSGAAIQAGIHGQGFNNFNTLVSNFDSGLSVTIGAQISISNTSGDTVYYRINVIPLGSRETTVYGR